MGGFLGGLADVLSGFYQVRRIDKEGFDWREKERQAELARQQQQQQWQQQNEDWETGAATDIALGAEPDTDISALLSDKVNKARVMARAGGGVAQSKPALESMRLNNRLQERAMQGDQRREQIELTGEQARERDRLRFEQQQGRTLNPAEQAKLDALERMNQARISARGQGGQDDEKPIRSPVTQNEQGETGTWLMYPRSGRREWYPAGATVTMRDTAAMGQTILDSLGQMKRAAAEGVTDGPIAGRLSKLWQAAYPSGNEGLFDTAAAQLVDIVYTKSGKQINEKEMKILQQLVPDRAKGNVEFQIERFENYADGLLRRYTRQGVGGNPSGAPPRSSGVGRRKFNPATGRIE